jgi:hypothetical protein
LFEWFLYLYLNFSGGKVMNLINRFCVMLLLSIFALNGSSVKGQIDVLDFIYGGLDDAEKILQRYMEPYANIVGADLNAGWYNTARPHSLGGFDVTATVSMARAPSSLLSFDVSGLSLNGTLDPTGPTETPTIAGKQADRPELVYTQNVGGNDYEYARFTLPNGTGYDYFPLPMAQLTVGLPAGTDVSVRFIPMIKVMDFGEIGLWGVGAKHSVSQWIPVLKRISLLDISVQGGFTSVTTSGHLKIEPLDVGVDPEPDRKWEDQYLVQKAMGWTLNLIASQKLLFITFYQGLGYSSSLVDLLLEGHYPVHSVITSGPDIGETTYEVIEDPISLEFENNNNFRINAGVRLKLAVLTLHYDFTHTIYSTHTVGIGVSFR